jgi:hypothetical protein
MCRISDALCRISTGGGFAARQLHTDGEETVFNSTRPIVLNGIDQVAVRGDLADRALNVFLPPIPENHRIKESDFWDNFAEASGRIFGALLDAVVSWLIQHSRRMMGIIRTNIVLSLLVKAIFVVLTFLGHTSLWAAIAADMGVSLLVIFTALRLR